MARKMKSGDAAKTDWMSCGERILNACSQLYTDTHCGLIAIAQSIGVTLLPPRKKITVMLMGNHSAGKSSFINWYVGEHVQKTGAALETQGFTFVTSGRKRESLMGNAAFNLYPHFEPLQEVKCVSECVCTEICTSQQKCFSLVTFVDTPGLVDNDVKYLFDVDKAIPCLGDVCDLILVFFDPMGQALCKRTLNIVEQLKERQVDGLRFYLSKADEAGEESDRQRVIMQIVQELRKRLGSNKCDLDLPTIYIPNLNKSSHCVNQIEEVCHTIQKTINQTVQNTLNTLEKDCELICEAVTDALNDDRKSCKENQSTCSVSYIMGLLGFIVLLLSTLMLGIFYKEVLVMVLGTYGTETLMLFLDPFWRMFHSVPVQIQLIVCGFFLQLSVTLLILAFLLFHPKPTLSVKQKIRLQEELEFVQEVVKTKTKKLYDEYLRQSVCW